MDIMANTPTQSDTTAAPGFPRVTFTPGVMGGKACIRGLRVTVAMVVGMLAHHTAAEVLAMYPYLQPDDLKEALGYAAWRLGEAELPLKAG